MSNLKATHIFEIRINAEGDKLCLANPSDDDSGAYRIAGPKAWGGSNLIEDIEIRESDLVTYIKEYAPHLAPIIASDLLEQQAAEIACNETVIRSLCLERDALKAHVELVKKIFITLNSCHLNSDWNENAGKLRSVIMQTPTHSLAEHDAEVARKAFMAGFQKGKIKRPVVDLRNPIDLANEYAERVKRGEV